MIYTGIFSQFWNKYINCALDTRSITLKTSQMPSITQFSHPIHLQKSLECPKLQFTGHGVWDVHWDSFIKLQWNELSSGSWVSYLFFSWFEMLFLRICFVKLKLLLVAIEVKDKEENSAKIAINPRQARTSTFTIGYFLAQSAEEVKRFKKIEEKLQ